MEVGPLFGGFPFESSRDAVLDEPGEMVPDARLPRFVAKEAWDDPIFHTAAHAGDDVFLASQHHVTDGGAHDHDHAPDVGDRGGRPVHAAACGVRPPALSPTDRMSWDIFVSTTVANPG